MPTWSALLGMFLLKERITPRIALSLALSLAAVGIIVSQEAAVRTAPVGTLLTLLAAISFSIGTVLTKRMGVAGDVTINAAWQILLGTVPVVIVWLAFAHGAYFHPEQVRGLAALAWLTLVSNVLAYACWFRIIRALPAAVASLTTLVVPCHRLRQQRAHDGGSGVLARCRSARVDHRRGDAGAGPAWAIQALTSVCWERGSPAAAHGMWQSEEERLWRAALPASRSLNETAGGPISRRS